MDKDTFSSNFCLCKGTDHQVQPLFFSVTIWSPTWVVKSALCDATSGRSKYACKHKNHLYHSFRPQHISPASLTLPWREGRMLRSLCVPGLLSAQDSRRKSCLTPLRNISCQPCTFGTKANHHSEDFHPDPSYRTGWNDWKLCDTSAGSEVAILLVEHQRKNMDSLQNRIVKRPVSLLSETCTRLGVILTCAASKQRAVLLSAQDGRKEATQCLYGRIYASLTCSVSQKKRSSDMTACLHKYKHIGALQTRHIWDFDTKSSNSWY